MMARHLTYEAAIAAQYAIEDRVAPALSPRDMLRRDMAWEAIGDLYFRDDLTMAEKAVAVFLHWFTGHYTNASPAIETIAKRVAAAERTTRAAIKKLAGSEFRMIEGGGSRPHQYLPKFTEETFEKRLRQIQKEPYAERVARLTAPIRRRVLPAECPAQTDEGGAECPAQTLTEINDCAAECPARTERVNVYPANGTDDKKESLTSTLPSNSDSTLNGDAALSRAQGAPTQEPLDLLDALEPESPPPAAPPKPAATRKRPRLPEIPCPWVRDDQPDLDAMFAVKSVTEIADKRGMSDATMRAQAEKFIRWHHGKDSRWSRWTQTWATWCDRWDGRQATAAPDPKGRRFVMSCDGSRIYLDD